MKFTSRLSQSITIHGCLAAICLSCSLLLAQEISLENRIDLIKTSLSTLDTLAAECIDQLNSRSKNESKCVDFMAHIDGQTATDLISNCNAVRSWREDYVENSITSNTSAETNLQRMRDVEFFCGENFLQKRTTYVSAAFELLNDKQRQAFSNLSISRRISELQFINVQDKERRSLQESMLLQNQRQQSENDNRRNELQRELIRQQINSVPYPQN